jgi:mRNA-degrading endonuclease RelE of RelBE toxin-antitoxin system
LAANDFRRRRNDQRKALEQIGRLEDSLTRTAVASGGETAISARDWNQVVRIEQEQIGRERVRAVAEGLRDSARKSYGVAKSPRFQEATSSLTPSERIRFEEQAEALSRTPRPPGVEVDPGSGFCRVRVPGTKLALSYEIDEATHRIVLLEAGASDRE